MKAILVLFIFIALESSPNVFDVCGSMSNSLRHLRLQLSYCEHSVLLLSLTVPLLPVPSPGRAGRDGQVEWERGVGEGFMHI